VCYVLTEKAFDQLRHEHAAIAITLVTNLGRELSRRLRQAQTAPSTSSRAEPHTRSTAGRPNSPVGRAKSMAISAT
jgi:CRP-like cAMP-binding protein